MEGNSPNSSVQGDARGVLERMSQSVDQAPEATATAIKEKQGNEMMGGIIDKLEASVKEKGVIAYVVGNKDEMGDHRAGILVSPVRQGERAGYVVLTPDGPMFAEATDRSGSQIMDVMPSRNDPDRYEENREAMKTLLYRPPRENGRTGALNGRFYNRDVNIFLYPLDTIGMPEDISVGEVFDKSVEEAGKALRSKDQQASITIKTAEDLNSRF